MGKVVDSGVHGMGGGCLVSWGIGVLNPFPATAIVKEGRALGEVDYGCYG